METRSTQGHGHGDRLSALPDATLGRILSHLGTVEAARTSVLSRRWHRVHASVPVVDLVDAKRGRRCRLRNATTMCFDHQVSSALLGRDPSAPIRALRLDVYVGLTTSLLDQWIVIALDSGAEEVDVKLRHFGESLNRDRLCPFGPYEESAADFDLPRINSPYTRTPGHMFRCGTLRRLRLTNWTLDLPTTGEVSLPSLDTLFLKRIMAPATTLQRLISSCPRLADLTLDECPGATEITVASTCLTSFSMVCCHLSSRVVLDSPRLRSLRYKGGLPPDTSFLSLANHAAIRELTIDICENIDEKKPHEVATVTKLIALCTNLTSLHLSIRPAMAYYSSLFTSALRGLSRLRQLELKGCLPSDHTVLSVGVLLQNAKNLEVLSLFPLLPDPPKKKKRKRYYSYDSDDELSEESDGKDVDYNGNVHVPNRATSIAIRCFQQRLRRVNLVGYRGRPLERMLAKFVLSKAMALEEFSVSLGPGRALHKDEMARELTYWRSYQHTKVTCL